MLKKTSEKLVLQGWEPRLRLCKSLIFRGSRNLPEQVRLLFQRPLKRFLRSIEIILFLGGQAVCLVKHRKYSVLLWSKGLLQVLKFCNFFKSYTF